MKTISLLCPGCDRGLIDSEKGEALYHPECHGSGIVLSAFKRRFKMSFHTLEMLRVIAASTTPEGRFWLPGAKCVPVGDRFRGRPVQVGGAGTVSAIKNLTKLGYVEIPPRIGADFQRLEPYARSCTAKGRAFLDEVYAAVSV